MNAYEFIIKMKNYASSSLKQIADDVGVADRKVDHLDNNMKQMEKTTGFLGKGFGRLKGFIVGAFAVGALTMFTSKVVNARSEYEKYNAVLANTFQSAEIGAGALNMLSGFAKETPFQLNELSDSFVKLVNRGFTPAQSEMTKLGDLAASQGKGFNQLSEAILDAETNEFERLKEFGIKASKSGDQVSFSFKGITKTVQNNATAIREAMLEYGAMTGVKNSMSAISKTLGGRISNLKDQFWSFLVAVGGQGSSIFADGIGLMSKALGFLTDHLPQITAYFGALWQMIEPVGAALWNLVQQVFGFESAGSVLDSFISVMMTGLQVFDWFTLGLTTLIGWLTPFSDVIMIAGGAWAFLNLMMAVSPLGWIVIGVTAVITAIGFLSKHVSFAGVTWKKVWDNAGLIFDLWVKSIKLQYTAMYQGIEIGLSKIQLGWYKFKNSIGLGDKSQNNEMISQINASVEARKKIITDGASEVAELGKQALNAVGIKVDTKGMKDDFNKIKNQFSNLGAPSAGTSAYDDYLKNKGATGGNNNASGGTTSSKGSIVSGGAKKTNITISIGKLTEDVNIYTESAEEGIEDLGNKIQEVLLRAINSVNQLQNA